MFSLFWFLVHEIQRFIKISTIIIITIVLRFSPKHLTILVHIVATAGAGEHDT